MMAAAAGMELYVMRVSSADNIADIPSREVRAAVANVIAFVVVACCDSVAGVDTSAAKEHRRAESGGSGSSSSLEVASWEVLKERWALEGAV